MCTNGKKSTVHIAEKSNADENQEENDSSESESEKEDTNLPSPLQSITQQTNHTPRPPTVLCKSPSTRLSQRRLQFTTIPTSNASPLPIQSPTDSGSELESPTGTKNSQIIECIQSTQKLKSGMFVKVLKKEDPHPNMWHTYKIISRSGKSTGRYAHSWNVQDEAGVMSSLDFKDDVHTYKVLNSSSLQHSDSEVEFRPNEILLAERNDDIQLAKQKELQSWKDQGVYEEVPYSEQPLMTVRWVTEKDGENGTLLKARLVAHGYKETQTFRTDSPTCTRESIRISLALISSKSWTLKSLDIKTAFLQSDTINRTIFVKPPPEAKTDMIWKLNKCIYGLADAPRCFYNRLKDVLQEESVICNNLDAGLFFCKDEHDEIIGIMVCHVDDLLYGVTELFEQQVINHLRNTLEFGINNSNYI